MVDEKTGRLNLARMFDKADAIDMDEGMVAYERYHMVMMRLAKKYAFTMEQTTAAFCALSPNNDYWGNLRSTVSVLEGIKQGTKDQDIVVSTYNHAKLRAISYAKGLEDFDQPSRGPKILNFYHNILTPSSSRWVTIDGHMSAIWQGKKLTMKEALVPRWAYDQIAHAVKEFAFKNYMLPQQMQAILWFVRKRTSNVVYDPQFDMFADKGDAWKTARDVDTIRSFTKRDIKRIAEILETQEELRL